MRGRGATKNTMPARQHERGAESEGQPSGAARTRRVACTDGLSHAYGGGCRDAQRHHIADAGVIERDGVGGKRDGGEIAGSKGAEVPGTDLEHNLAGSRPAQAHEPAKALDLRRSPVAKEGMSALALIAPGEGDQRNGHGDA